MLPAAAAVPDMEGLDEFGKTAALAMDSVGRFDERVILSWSMPAERYPFHFPEGGRQSKVECEASQAFQIIAHSNVQASFNVGACSKDAKRVTAMAAASEAESKRLLDQLFGDRTGKPEERMKMERLLAYREAALAGGVTGQSFTTMIIGHGFLFVHTAVVHDPKRGISFVVQADVSSLCYQAQPDAKTLSPQLCQDTNKALMDIAADLARRYRNPKAR